MFVLVGCIDWESGKEILRGETGLRETGGMEHVGQESQKEATRVKDTKGQGWQGRGKKKMS